MLLLITGTPGAGSCMLWALHVCSCTLTWGRLALCTVRNVMPACDRGSDAAAADFACRNDLEAGMMLQLFAEMGS